MTTATIDQPETTQATPAPPTPARPGPWATNAQRTLATYLKPLEVLTPPTAGTCLDDLLDVRAVLAPGEADPVNAAALVKARIRSEGGPDQLARDLATKIARERQMERGRVEFSNTKVVELTELILEMLTAVDVAIGLAVAERPDPRIIRVADFGPQGITSVYCPEYSYAATGAQGVYLCAGIVEHLPDDHPLHQDFSAREQHGLELSVPDGNGKGWSKYAMTIILGPQIPTPNFRAIAGRPRAWYLATTARTWHRRHTGLGAMVQPPPPPPLPAPVGSWRENVLAAHSLFSSPRRAFVAPPAGTSLDDLLLVREALGVRDAELTPLADAASTFASRVAGDLRFRDLLDALPALFLGMEKGIRLKLEEGQRWAARQAEKECRNK